MATFLLKRLGLMVLTLWILSLIVFFAGQILPGDPGRAILGPFAAKSSVDALDTQLGVNRPLLTRYLQKFPDLKVIICHCGMPPAGPMLGTTADGGRGGAGVLMAGTVAPTPSRT